MAEKKNKWTEGLAITRNATFGKVANFFGASEINIDTWDNLEALLIQSDIGINLSLRILEQLKDEASKNGWTKTAQLKHNLKNYLSDIFHVDQEAINIFATLPTVILIVGINGSGKTTTIAKLSARFQKQGKTVLLAAADTFRAAAIEQLQSWGEKLDIRVISGTPNGDPGAVTYDAVQSLISRKEDVLIVDTAGRMHTKYNLMEELKKIHRVAGKFLAGSPHHVWLTLDASIGQNALQQAKAFSEAIPITGIIITKLDSSAHGGILFAIQEELKIPILFAGFGEGEDDLIEFDKQAFVESILLNL
jgi:fused signal recognition particle receptor